MKKRIIVTICILLCLAILTAYILITYIGKLDFDASNESLYNHYQGGHSMFVHDSEVYYLQNFRLYKIENGWKKKVDIVENMLSELGMYYISKIEYVDGYIYASISSQFLSSRFVYSLNLDTGEYALVDELDTGYVFLDEDRETVVISDFDKDETPSLMIKNGKIIGETNKSYYTVSYNEKSFGVKDTVNKDLCLFEDSKYTELGIKVSSYFPCEQGVLLVRDAVDVVCLFKPETNMFIPVLTTEEASIITTSANCYGDYLYVSVFRRYMADSGYYRSYDNDEHSGTYRINIHTLECEKISNLIFDEIYIFDNSGILGLDWNNLYKIDFDGTLLEDYGSLETIDSFFRKVD